MKNGIVIIDADGHAVDYEPVYRERLPAQYRNRVSIYPNDNFDRTQNGKLAAKRPPSPAQNLADNAQEGIDVQIIYPTGGLMLARVREPDYAVALCRAYNDWLYDWCAIDRRRLKAVALVPLHVDTRAAIDEMVRAVSKLGNVGVMVNTYDRSRNVAHRDFWPFYEECARQGVAVAFHASGSEVVLTVYYKVELPKTAKPAPEPNLSYPVPAQAKTPKHLFHFIIRYEGEGIIDDNIVKAMKDYYRAEKQATQRSSQAPPGYCAPVPTPESSPTTPTPPVKEKEEKKNEKSTSLAR